MKNFLKVITLHIDENKLIRNAIRGHRESQQKLFQSYSPKMLSVCRYYIKDIHYAEDVMVGAFFKVFKHLEYYKGVGSFEGWIRKITIRECLTFLRDRKQFIFLEDNSYESTNELSEEMSIELEVEDIQTLIDSLPLGYKTVFLMYAIEGYSHKEIAAYLKITESTSKSQLFKARRLLQEQINNLKIKDNENKSFG